LFLEPEPDRQNSLETQKQEVASATGAYKLLKVKSESPKVVAAVAGY
jgi:hypothetical protein